VFTTHGGGKFDDGKNTGSGESGEFKSFHDHCARLSYDVYPEVINDCINGTAGNQCAGFPGADAPERTAQWAVSKFKEGWDYIDINEIKVVGAVDFRDGSGNSMKLDAALHHLELLGYPKRLIVWFSTGQTDIDQSSSPDPLASYTTLFAVCIDHCRKMIFEGYQNTTQIENGHASRIETLAQRLHNIHTGANDASIMAIGVGNSDPNTYLNDPKCDLSPFKGTCAALPNSGGMLAQFNAMRNGTYASNWDGVAFYSLSSVVSNSTWSTADFANSVKKRVSSLW